MNTVIFACVHNAGRSQMAAAWFNALAESAKAHAISAGTDQERGPSEVLTPCARSVDLSDRTPQKLTDDPPRRPVADHDGLTIVPRSSSCAATTGRSRIQGKPIARARDSGRCAGTRRRLPGERDGPAMIRHADAQDFAVSRCSPRRSPHRQVPEHFRSFFVVDDGGRIMASAGLGSR
jgi:hypothetical protein